MYQLVKRKGSMVGLYGITAPVTQRPTGHRVTRKVRAVAARHREALGDLRHVESNSPPPPRVIIWTVILVGGLSVAVALQGGDIAGIAAVIAFTILLAAGIVTYIGGEKLLIFERGILIGSCAPFLTPYAITFDQIDARTISANLAGPRGVGLLMANRGAGRANRSVPWSLRSVTFMAIAPAVLRNAARRRVPAPTNDPRFFTLWVFSVRHITRLEPLIHALATAMQAAHTPGADGITTHALPPRRLRQSTADADHLGIPTRDRATDLR